MLASLARQLLNDTRTDLSEGELLSLLAAGLNQPEAIEFSALPLEPASPGQRGLRQLAPLAAPVWSGTL